jgi:lysophospholipase L1-like esterase
MPLPNPAGSRVLLHAGTNDLLDGLSIADAVDNVEDTITLIDAHDPSIDIYVALIVPNTISAEDDLITDYNNALTDRLVILQQTKSNLFIVDMNSALKQNPFWRTEYMADSVHPNNAGYAVMAETWAQSIAANE